MKKILVAMVALFSLVGCSVPQETCETLKVASRGKIVDVKTKGDLCVYTRQSTGESEEQWFHAVSYDKDGVKLGWDVVRLSVLEKGEKEQFTVTPTKGAKELRLEARK